MKNLKKMTLAIVAMVSIFNAAAQKDTLINTKNILSDSVASRVFMTDKIIIDILGNTMVISSNGSVSLLMSTIQSKYGDRYKDFEFEISFSGTTGKKYWFNNVESTFNSTDIVTERHLFTSDLLLKAGNDAGISFKRFRLFAAKGATAIKQLKEIEGMHVFSHGNNIVFDADDTNDINVEILNITGQTLYSERMRVIGKREVGFAQLSSGIYILKVTDITSGSSLIRKIRFY